MPPDVDGPVAQCACGHLHPRSAGRLHRRVWRSGARAAGAAFLTFALSHSSRQQQQEAGSSVLSQYCRAVYTSCMYYGHVAYS
jgi:hypothetical protein